MSSDLDICFCVCVCRLTRASVGSDPLTSFTKRRRRPKKNPPRHNHMMWVYLLAIWLLPFLFSFEWTVHYEITTVHTVASFSRENNPGVRLNMRYMIPLVFQLYHTTWMTFFKNSDFMTRFPLSFSFCCQHHLIDRSIPNQSRVTVVRPFFSRLFFFLFIESHSWRLIFFSLSLSFFPSQCWCWFLDQSQGRIEYKTIESR